ncbi:MAG: glyoxylase-like metal-dependent hydrolase (beta-lactamase superfamily II) [Gammaproteobacteria bacterium]|jgi:glyoxylase-like metal-dependent hydrolase (beta-lactamase superfamily II)
MIFLFHISLLATMLFSSMAVADKLTPTTTSEDAAQAHPLQHIGPVRTYNPYLATDVRVKASSTRKLKPGERVDIPYVPPMREWIVQRLTDRSYWFLSDQFAVTVFVGDRETLVIDAPDIFDMEAFVRQVALITPLPITTVVYSHPHVDHVGNAGKLAQVLKKEGINLRIIASENALREIKRYKNSIPTPTEIVANGHSEFQFEDRTFKYVTPVDWAHTGADSYIITPGGVLHIVDFFYPGRLPLAEVSGVQNMTGWIEMCRYVAGDPDWQLASLGHANIGHRGDVLRTLEYFKDLYTHAFDVFKGFQPEFFQQFAGQNTGVMIRSMFDGGAEQLAQLVADKWHHLPQWEVARDHAEKVLWDVALNYNYHERTLPDFEPIPAP